MDLVKSTVRLDFAEATHPWLEIREIMRVAGGQPKAELRVEPLVLEQPDKRQRIFLHVRAVWLEHESPTSADQSVAQALEMLGRLNEASKFPPIKQIRHDSVFIEPYALPFHELVVFLKERFLRPNAIVDSATDIGLVFDEHGDETVKHIQIGPMDAEQLRREYLRWPEEGIPDTFLFIGLGYVADREAPYEVESLREFLQSAVAWQVDQAEAIVNSLWGEGR